MRYENIIRLTQAFMVVMHIINGMTSLAQSISKLSLRCNI